MHGGCRLCRAALEVGNSNNLEFLGCVAPSPVSLVTGLFIEAIENPMEFLEREGPAIVVADDGSACEFCAILGNLPEITFRNAEEHGRLDRGKLAQTLFVLRGVFHRNDFLLRDLADIGSVAEAVLQARKSHTTPSVL